MHVIKNFIVDINCLFLGNENKNILSKTVLLKIKINLPEYRELRTVLEYSNTFITKKNIL